MADFGITPAQIARIAAVWRHHGSALGNCEVTAPGPASSCESVSATGAFCTHASTASAADASRLSDLGDALRRFNALSQESDRVAAAAIGTASHRSAR